MECRIKNRETRKQEWRRGKRNNKGQQLKRNKQRLKKRM